MKQMKQKIAFNIPWKYTSIIVLLMVLLIALFISSWKSATSATSIKEGYKMMPDLETPITKSDLYVILTECVNNIIAHETVLNTFDPSYPKDTIKVNTSLPDMENIKKILAFIKKQDIQIHKMLPNYLMNQDIDGLISGTLLADGAAALAKKSKYPDNVLDCDPETINRAIKSYQDILSKYNCDEDKNKGTCMTYNSYIISLTKSLVEIKSASPSPGNTKCLPPLLPSEAEGIMDGRYANALAKIIKSQDIAIETLKTKVQMEITQFYSVPINTGAPPANPLDVVL
jgi:hypothetical protein